MGFNYICRRSKTLFTEENGEIKEFKLLVGQNRNSR